MCNQRRAKKAADLPSNLYVYDWKFSTQDLNVKFQSASRGLEDVGFR